MIKALFSLYLSKKYLLIYLCIFIILSIISLFNINIFSKTNEQLLYSSNYLYSYIELTKSTMPIFLLISTLIISYDIDNNYYIQILAEVGIKKTIYLRSLVILIINISLLLLLYLLNILVLLLFTKYFSLNNEVLLMYLNIFLDTLIILILFFIFSNGKKRFINIILTGSLVLYKIIIEDINNTFKKVLFYILPIFHFNNTILLIYKIIYFIITIIIFDLIITKKEY